jgi:hypothetical protein
MSSKSIAAGIGSPDVIEFGIIVMTGLCHNTVTGTVTLLWEVHGTEEIDVTGVVKVRARNYKCRSFLWTKRNWHFLDAISQSSILI